MKRIINYNYYINSEDLKFIENEIKMVNTLEEKNEIIDNFIDNIIEEIVRNEDSIFEFISKNSLRKRLYLYLLLSLKINYIKTTFYESKNTYIRK